MSNEADKLKRKAIIIVREHNRLMSTINLVNPWLENNEKRVLGEKTIEKIVDLMEIKNTETDESKDSQIASLIEAVTKNSHNHGWTVAWNKTTIDTAVLSVGDKIALIHSELSEALEAYRDDDKYEFSVEIADVFIRLFHMCGDLDINIETFIEEKMKKNESRPQKHGRKNY